VAVSQLRVNRGRWLGFGYIVPITVLASGFRIEGLITGSLWRAWRWCAGDCSCGYAIDSERWCVTDFCLSWCCVFRDYNAYRLFHAEPAGWMETGRLGSEHNSNQTTRGKRLHSGEALKSWQWYALWVLLFLNSCAGISLISKSRRCFRRSRRQRHRRGRHGRDCQHWQRGRSYLLGVDFGPDHAAMDFYDNVPASGGLFWVLPSITSVRFLRLWLSSF